jgi:hypothetical protein
MTEGDYIASGLADAVAKELWAILLREDEAAKAKPTSRPTFRRRKR